MTYAMIVSICVFLLTYFFIATEKMDKTIAAMLGAGAVIALRAADYKELLTKIDLNVIFLLVGMMVIVNILAQTGIFEWLAIMIARRAKGNGMAIMLLFMVVTAVVSAFLDNVTTIILIAPITILITQILEIPTVPILILEAVFSNIGGTATLVGDPPNILIGSSTGLSFNSFIYNLAPVVLVIGAVALVIVALLFKKATHVEENAKARIAKAKPEKAIIEPLMLKKALAVFTLVLLGFFLSHFIHMEPGIVALAGAFLMALVCRVDLHKALEKVEWNTILFFIGLFMLIGSLECNKVFEELGGLVLSVTQGNLLLTALMILWVSAILSAIVDNIPLVIAMIPLINSIIPVFAAKMGLEGEAVMITIKAPLFWSLALGACLGGNGTLIGASANVVISQIATRNKYKMSFAQFTKYGFPIMILSLVISSGYIYLRYFCW